MLLVHARWYLLCPLMHCAVKDYSPGLLGRISSGLRAPVHPEVEASREKKAVKEYPMEP